MSSNEVNKNVGSGERKGEERREGDAPGFDNTSYASFTVAIFASLPPLSGCAVITALRLSYTNESRD